MHRLIAGSPVSSVAEAGAAFGLPAVLVVIGLLWIRAAAEWALRVVVPRQRS
jgi:hypothetical protein